MFQKYLEEELRIANRLEEGCEREGPSGQEGSWSELWKDDSPSMTGRPAAMARDGSSAGTWLGVTKDMGSEVCDGSTVQATETWKQRPRSDLGSTVGGSMQDPRQESGRGCLGAWRVTEPRGCLAL